MTHIIANRVQETTVTAGAGDLVLVASPGYRRFGDRMSVGDTCWYLVEQFLNGVPVAWEYGVGTYKGNNLLERTRVLESTNSNAKVSFDGSKKLITLTVVAPNTDTAAEWCAALGISVGTLPGDVDLEAQRSSTLSVLTSVSAYIRAQALSLDAL